MILSSLAHLIRRSDLMQEVGSGHTCSFGLAIDYVQAIGHRGLNKRMW